MCFLLQKLATILRCIHKDYYKNPKKRLSSPSQSATKRRAVDLSGESNVPNGQSKLSSPSKNQLATSILSKQASEAPISVATILADHRREVHESRQQLTHTLICFCQRSWIAQWWGVGFTIVRTCVRFPCWKYELLTLILAQNRNTVRWNIDTDLQVLVDRICNHAIVLKALADRSYNHAQVLGDCCRNHTIVLQVLADCHHNCVIVLQVPAGCLLAFSLWVSFHGHVT